MSRPCTWRSRRSDPCCWQPRSVPTTRQPRPTWRPWWKQALKSRRRPTERVSQRPQAATHRRPVSQVRAEPTVSPGWPVRKSLRKSSPPSPARHVRCMRHGRWRPTWCHPCRWSDSHRRRASQVPAARPALLELPKNQPWRTFSAPSPGRRVRCTRRGRWRPSWCHPCRWWSHRRRAFPGSEAQPALPAQRRRPTSSAPSPGRHARCTRRGRWPSTWCRPCRWWEARRYRRPQPAVPTPGTATARRTHREDLCFSIELTPCCFWSPANCKPIRVETYRGARPTGSYGPGLGAGANGSNSDTFIRKRVYSFAAVASNREPSTLTREFSMMVSGNSAMPTSCRSVAYMHW